MTDFIKEDRSIRTPMALLPYQQRWVGDEADVKIIEKSRRIGLSWCEAADDALLAAKRSGMDVWYIGYNKDMAQEFIEDCGDWLRHYNKAAGEIEEIVVKDEDRDILAFRIRCASGHKITALSSRPSNLRGKQGKVVLDEAAFHDNLRELIKAAMALLMWGGRVVVVSTHNGESNYFNELIQDIRAGKYSFSLHRVTLDDALAEGLYERICLRLGRKWSREGQDEWRARLIEHYGDGADEELFCIPSQGSGTYLARALIESCMADGIPVIRYEQADEFARMHDSIRQAEVADWCEAVLKPLLDELEPDLPCVFGEDFARSGDLSIFLPMQETQQLVLRTIFLLELRNIPFQQQEQILYYIVDRLPGFRHGALDARGNGQYLAERAMQRYGERRISQVMLSESWYRENMPAYKASFEDKTILLPRDQDVVEDNRAFKMIKGVAKLPDTKTRGADDKQRHGDAGIAGTLARYAARQEGGGPIEFEVVGAGRIFKQTNSFLEAGA